MNFNEKLALIDLIKSYGAANRLMKESELNGSDSAENFWRDDKNEKLQKIIDIIGNL